MVVGSLSSLNYRNEAFRWERGTLQGLGYIESLTLESMAIDVSADGARVIGFSGEDELDRVPFVWEEDSGMRPLRLFLAERGLEEDIEDDFYILPEAISADGQTIVGVAQASSGGGAFRLRLLW